MKGKFILNVEPFKVYEALHQYSKEILKKKKVYWGGEQKLEYFLTLKDVKKRYIIFYLNIFITKWGSTCYQSLNHEVFIPKTMLREWKFYTAIYDLSDISTKKKLEEITF